MSAQKNNYHYARVLIKLTFSKTQLLTEEKNTTLLTFLKCVQLLFQPFRFL